MTAKKIMASVLVLLCLSLMLSVFWGNDSYADEGKNIYSRWIQDEDGNWYYLNEGGAYVTGWQKIDGDWYYFYKDDDRYGVMAESTFEIIDGKTYYFVSSGEMAIGWEKINGYWYYFYQSGSMATGWEKVGDDWYYLYNDGKMAENTLVLYSNNTNEHYYYVNPSGKMLPNKWVKYDEGWRYERGNGSYTIDTYIVLKGKIYYFDEDGYMITGWINHQGRWVYASSSGALVESGWEKIDGYWYYFDGFFILTDTFRIIDEEIYYFTEMGDMAIGWEKLNGEWFYFNPSGHMLTGWQEIGDEWYYFYEDDYNLGVMASNVRIRYIDENNNIPYYLDHSGKRLPNKWQKCYGNIWCYILGDGNPLKDSSIIENGETYCFDTGGFLTPCEWER